MCLKFEMLQTTNDPNTFEMFDVKEGWYVIRRLHWKMGRYIYIYMGPYILLCNHSFPVLTSYAYVHTYMYVCM